MTLSIATQLHERALLLGKKGFHATARDATCLWLFLVEPGRDTVESVPGAVRTWGEYRSFLRHTLIPDLTASREPPLWASAQLFTDAIEAINRLHRNAEAAS